MTDQSTTQPPLISHETVSVHQGRDSPNNTPIESATTNPNHIHTNSSPLVSDDTSMSTTVPASAAPHSATSMEPSSTPAATGVNSFPSQPIPPTTTPSPSSTVADNTVDGNAVSALAGLSAFAEVATAASMTSLSTATTTPPNSTNTHYLSNSKEVMAMSINTTTAISAIVRDRHPSNSSSKPNSPVAMARVVQETESFPPTGNLFPPSIHTQSMTHTHAPKSRENVPKVQIRVKLACSNCKASKTKCDDERPCRRCVRTDRSHTCQDSERCNMDTSSSSEGDDQEHKQAVFQHQLQLQHQQQQALLRQQQQQLNLSAGMTPYMMMPNQPNPYLPMNPMTPQYSTRLLPPSFLPPPNQPPQPMYHVPPTNINTNGMMPQHLYPPTPSATTAYLPQPQLLQQIQPPPLLPPSQPLVTLSPKPATITGPTSNFHHVKSDMDQLDDRAGKRVKLEDGGSVTEGTKSDYSSQHRDSSASLPSLTTISSLSTNSITNSSDPNSVVQSNVLVSVPSTPVPSTREISTKSFCSPSGPAGRQFLEVLVTVALPHIHMWQEQLHQQEMNLQQPTFSDLSEKKAALQISLRRLEWLQSFFRFLYPTGPANHQESGDLSQTLSVPKHLYSQLRLGVLLFPLSTTDLQHHTPPWVNDSLTQLLGYQQTYQVEHLCSSVDGMAQLFHPSNLVTYVPQFIDAVMAGSNNYSIKTKWRHSAGHWVEMLESINITYDQTEGPKKGSVLYLASLMQVIQQQVPTPAPCPSVVATLQAAIQAQQPPNNGVACPPVAPQMSPTYSTGLPPQPSMPYFTSQNPMASYHMPTGPNSFMMMNQPNNGQMNGCNQYSPTLPYMPPSVNNFQPQPTMMAMVR